MATLYTNGDFVERTIAQFSSYSLIRFSAQNPSHFVELGLSDSGTMNFSTRLGSVSALLECWTGADNITMGSGNDTVWGNAGNDTLNGGAGDDFLLGDWDFDDVFGNDSLYGGDGNDEMIGGAGNDALYGGNGDDVFSIGEPLAGGDSYYGGAGEDSVLLRITVYSWASLLEVSRLVLNVAASVEYLVQFDPGLRLSGTSGNDIFDLTGTTVLTWNGAGYDNRISLELPGGSDTLLGSEGAESVVATTGGDRIRLNGGDDTLNVFDGMTLGSTLDGGEGFDYLQLGNTTSPVGSGAEITISGLDYFGSISFEQVLINADTTINGTDQANFFNLPAWPDMIIRGRFQLQGGGDKLIGGTEIVRADGGSGQDTLIGGSADDYLIGGSGGDRMVGGEGGDVYQVDDSRDTVVERGTTGVDAVQVSISQWRLDDEIENLAAFGEGGLVGFGNLGANVLTGGAGKDSLSGLRGNDRLIGAGGDSLLGGQGDDTYVISGKAVTLIELADQGLDTIVAQGINAWTLSAEIENLVAEGSVAFRGTGNAGANLISSQYGNDTLKGMEGNDTLDGLSGSNTLIGGLGDDLFILSNATTRVVEEALGGVDTIRTNQASFALDGLKYVENLEVLNTTASGAMGNGLANSLTTGSGNDRLDGAGGHDTLTGGVGEDRFIFAGPSGFAFNPDNSDHITDFVAGQDNILLYFWSFSALSPGMQFSAQDFKVISGGGVRDETDCILYDQTTGELFYDNDRLAKNAPRLVAVLDSLPLLSAADFEIIF